MSPVAENKIQLTWKEIACKLWGLLGDISTLNDACKSNDSAFRKLACKKSKERNKYINSLDGKLVKSE
jgi:hypothetical protein